MQASSKEIWPSEGSTVAFQAGLCCRRAERIAFITLFAVLLGGFSFFLSIYALGSKLNILVRDHVI